MLMKMSAAGRRQSRQWERLSRIMPGKKRDLGGRWRKGFVERDVTGQCDARDLFTRRSAYHNHLPTYEYTFCNALRP